MAVSVVIATIYYIINLTNVSKSRQIQSLMDLMKEFHKSDYQKEWIEVMYHQDWKDYYEWWDKYGPVSNPEAACSGFCIITSMSDIGHLVKEGVVDPKLVYNLDETNTIRLAWDKFEPLYKIWRNENPRAGESFEYLVNELKKIEEQTNIKK
jgi:hypothetical protein